MPVLQTGSYFQRFATMRGLLIPDRPERNPAWGRAADISNGKYSSSHTF